MKLMWLGRKVRQTIKNFRNMKLIKLSLILVVATFVIILGTFGIWQLQQMVSPDSGGIIKSGVTAQLKSSDRSRENVPLANNLEDPTQPDYLNTTITSLGNAVVGGDIPFARIQGEVIYYE